MASKKLQMRCVYNIRMQEQLRCSMFIVSASMVNVINFYIFTNNSKIRNEIFLIKVVYNMSRYHNSESAK